MLSYMFDRHSTLSKSSDKFGGVLSLESPPPHENKNSIEVQSINNLDIK